MKDTAALATLRERIILAGIAEISRNGITGFSMRRVSAACNISCATPYSYFENKDKFMLEMLRYIRGQWELMEKAICDCFDEEREKIIESSMTYIRFLNANPQFLAVIMLGNIDATSEQTKEKHMLTDSMGKRIENYRISRGDDEESAAGAAMIVKSVLYGATLLLGDGEDEKSVFPRVREAVIREIDAPQKKK